MENVGNWWKPPVSKGLNMGGGGVPDLRHSQNMAKSTISRGFRRWTWWCSCSSLAQWVLDWSHILWSWFVTVPSDSHWMSLKYSTGTPLLIWLVAWVSTWRNEVRNFHMDLTPNHDMKQHGCVFKMKSSSKAIVVNVIFRQCPHASAGDSVDVVARRWHVASKWLSMLQTSTTMRGQGLELYVLFNCLF